VSRQRADTLLFERGYFDSRAKAQEAIAAGLVRADGEVVRKASQGVLVDARIEAEAPHPYVSRGGVKLAHALTVFRVDPAGRDCLDVGASTGGFTDCLLRQRAAHVTAVDTGRGQLHPTLAGNLRVVQHEATDIRQFSAQMLLKPPTLVVIDVSFISLGLVLPAATRLVAAEAHLIALIKPQFEVGKAHIGKGGVVRDAQSQQRVCEDIAGLLITLGWSVTGLTESPIEGGDGNREFLIGARRAVAIAPG
jgi:23S rRNA (cytidine1920-2'-O)/16S rRNA (cytidine1409-2'-O)-methyltransferase